jgi:hypothetical protein
MYCVLQEVAMGKYEPLTEFLRKQRTDRIAMTFSEIERVVGFKLPRSAIEHRAWWSNNSSNSVMTKAWLEAGFQSEQVDMAAGKLIFSRLDQSSPAENKRNPRGEGEPQSLYGWLEGTVRLAPDVDLTEPADPEWGKRTYG